MTGDHLIRWANVGLLAATLFTSGFYRARAERHGGSLPAKPDGLPATSIRVLIGLAVWAVLLLPIVAPSTVRWATVELPLWVRWVGLALTAAAWPVLWWTLASIGTNISPSVSTRANAKLVTHGPYRLVRHPLYSAGFLSLVGLGLSLPSIPLLVGAAVLIWWLPRRASREELNLTASFGDQYREYAKRTGRLIPRLHPKD